MEKNLQAELTSNLARWCRPSVLKRSQLEQFPSFEDLVSPEATEEDKVSRFAVSGTRECASIHSSTALCQLTEMPRRDNPSPGHYALSQGYRLPRPHRVPPPMCDTLLRSQATGSQPQTVGAVGSERDALLAHVGLSGETEQLGQWLRW